MSNGLIVGFLIISGAPWLFVVLTVLALIEPLVGLTAILVIVLRNRIPSSRWSIDVRFCTGVSAELRGGSSLRDSLAAAAEDIGEVGLARSCRVGRPYEELAAKVEAVLPIAGAAAGGAIRIAGESGGRVAVSFEAIAALAADEQEMRDEQQSSTAQVRASAFVIAALPLLILSALAASGRLGLLVSGGGLSITLMFLGLLLITAGMFALWWMMRRAQVG